MSSVIEAKGGIHFRSQEPLTNAASSVHEMASLVAQMVKNLPTVWEPQVRSLGQEDPPKKGTAPHSSILAWRVPWKGEPRGLQSMGSQRVGHD